MLNTYMDNIFWSHLNYSFKKLTLWKHFFATKNPCESFTLGVVHYFIFSHLVIPKMPQFIFYCQYFAITLGCDAYLTVCFVIP